MGVEGLIDSVLDHETLNSMYILNKIRYDAKSYSLKDRLLAADVCGAPYHISYIGYDAELTLERLLKGSKEFGGRKFNELEWKSEHFSVEDLATVRLGVYGTPIFVKRGDMYVRPEMYFRTKDIGHVSRKLSHSDVINVKNLEELKTDDTFQALLQLHIALAHDSSIARHLMWLGTSWNTKTLSELCTLEPLVKSLDESSVETIPTIHVPVVESWMRLPVNAKPGVADEVQRYGYESSSVKRNYVVRLQIASYFKIIAYGLEVLHAIYTIPNPTYVALLQRLLLKNPSKISTWLYEPDGTSLKYPKDVLDIINCHDPEKRFELIRNYLNRIDVWDLANMSTARDDTVENEPVPEWLLAICAYCNELSTWHIRTTYISILYKACMDRHLLDASNMSEDEYADVEAMLEDAKEFFGDAMSESTATESTSMMDLDIGKRSYKDRAPTPGISEHVPPTIEALDKLAASYNDDRYSFDVKDVVDTKPNARYTRIAESTELLNKNLIKRIKEIKVYNTGGKNPGMSRGKLDRKALYKYKTCKDIFYDNTYKVKESDLAFGLILDVSGSMCGEGIKNGVATMIILHETLKALGINHSIITHTSNGHYHSDIRRYQAFKEDKTYSMLKNYALADIVALNGNCDSGALFYMEKALSRVKNKDKICIMFSDGEPTECSGTDLKEQVAKMERQGIKVIGVGINYSNIKNYYNEYANGKNLKEMFEIVANILKRYVLEKED